ncbi:DUF1007 family protein [Bauldia litoralis]|uniref:ABC-type uncharacterized transport system, substrate-binding protein n=1 Tax=Bauldia litoralis TaxID=665467 RepID=A0A1G6DU26_9HYPH|nr:DUF1007 family protein [Bauldia litoralis]SDB48631.1 ABC-type uncharacterized transport system, substrate-binding protein [Bauldia litoralis]
MLSISSRTGAGFVHARLLLVLSAAAGPAILPEETVAHPHVFVDAKVEVVFDDAGRLAAVRNIWRFDPAFSQYAIEGLDTDGDGTFSENELASLSRVNVESLAEFGYFTYLRVGDRAAGFGDAENYWLELDGEQLTLFYTLPVAEPFVIQQPPYLEIFDAAYFVGFGFDEVEPFRLVNAPEGCTGNHQLPEELDVQTMTILGQLPADQRSLPPELAEATKSLANYIEIDCGGRQQLAAIDDAEVAAIPLREPANKAERHWLLGAVLILVAGGGSAAWWIWNRSKKA